MLKAAAEVDLDELRALEFGRLDRDGQTYLDYTGSALYGESQLRAHQSMLTAVTFGNPHSDSGPSQTSAELIDRARERVLRFFDVDSSTHTLCFTANTTAAIKLVAESYPFGPDKACVLAADAHNSLNGIREYARKAGARTRYVPLDPTLRLAGAGTVLAEEASPAGGLFAFPAQSNFSGVRHPLDLIARAQTLGFDVLLDAAAFVPSHRLSLREWPADFTVLSFYKLFGYPTGLGALVARNESLARLRRPWFSGGTVKYASVVADTHRLRPAHEGFEDGTPDFIGIAALEPGFDLLERVGMDRICRHVDGLRAMLARELQTMKHHSGAPLVTIYGPADSVDCGGAVAINVLRRNGQVVPYAQVERRALQSRVAFRGGCFCNPGASEAAFGADPLRLATCLASLAEDFSPERLAECTGTAAGAIRISIGLANNQDDVARALDVLATFRE